MKSVEFSRGQETVYLAEDDRALRAVLAEALARAGYSVLELHSGRALLEQLSDAFLGLNQAWSPCAIVSDLCMPGFNGLEVIGVLRQYDARTPVVLISAFADEDVRRRALQSGVHAVLSKPFGHAELISILRRALAAAA